MVLSAINFNSHPELSDDEWIIATFNVAYGQGPNQQSIDNARTAIISSGGGAQGRYALIFGPGGWVPSGTQGNWDDNWFRNLPTWSWIVFVPIVAIATVFAAWRAWGHIVKETMEESGNGSSKGY